MKKVWTPLENLRLDQLETNKELLKNKEAASLTSRYQNYYEMAKQQKSDLEKIQPDIEDYEKSYNSVSQWINHTSKILLESKPLTHQTIQEQLDTLKVHSMS